MTECNEHYGNPSCIHSMGQKSRELIENTRDQIARSISTKPNEIIFTSGGTESNNLAIQGFVNANNRRNHIITTVTEHMSVLNSIKYLYDMGCDVTFLPVDKEGKINLRQLENSIRRNTILISIMFANNEIGTIQPIKKISKIAKHYGICFHTDAVSAFGHCDINVDELGIDMMSISGHKIYAPKGVGVLYVKNDIELSPLFYGSNQEYGLRSGTENVTSIIGMGKAIEVLDKTENAHLLALKNKLIDEINTKIPNVKFNGSIENSLPNIVNVSFEGIDGKDLVIELDAKNIYASTGSPYFTSRSKSSHVLTAIGLSDYLAYSSIRFSFGKDNTESDIDYILDVLPKLINTLRTN